MASIPPAPPCVLGAMCVSCAIAPMSEPCFVLRPLPPCKSATCFRHAGPDFCLCCARRRRGSVFGANQEQIECA
eukprot:11216774-Lingulodinium_polyedra.AAC.1